MIHQLAMKENEESLKENEERRVINKDYTCIFVVLYLGRIMQ